MRLQPAPSRAATRWTRSRRAGSPSRRARRRATWATAGRRRGGGRAGAIDGDDWAGVAPAPAAPAISSPFAGDGAAERAGAGGDDSDDEDDEDRPAELERGFLELTRDNVDKVLDEVRPYLIADGGNIVVADVDAEARVVTLALQGACGLCARRRRR